MAIPYWNDTNGTRWSDADSTAYTTAWASVNTAQTTGLSEYEIMRLMQIQAAESDPRNIEVEIKSRQARGAIIDKRIKQRRQWGVDSRRELVGRGGPQGLEKHRKWTLAVRRG